MDFQAGVKKISALKAEKKREKTSFCCMMPFLFSWLLTDAQNLYNNNQAPQIHLSHNVCI